MSNVLYNRLGESNETEVAKKTRLTDFWDVVWLLKLRFSDILKQKMELGIVVEK